MDEKHIADYFIISGISDNLELSKESKPLVTLEKPITDITVIFKSLGEKCPIGYTCIEKTPDGHSADLNNGNFKSQNIQICYRRGLDKPPLVDVGVYHEDKDRVLPDVEVVYTTPYGRCASTGTSGSKSGTFINYRRAKTNSPFNQLVVVDLCVILNNKSENPPHAFYPIKKNLNKSYYGMIGSEVFLCYKKTLLTPPSLTYTPQIISRFPLEDYEDFKLPQNVPLFCLPVGANIEFWPENTPPSKPTSSKFVLTTDSAQKIYGSAYSFYEPFDSSNLTAEQRSRLCLPNCDKEEEFGATSGTEDCSELIKAVNASTSDHQRYGTYSIKSICILSRWPFFDCFEKFLQFLHRLVFNPKYYHQISTSSPSCRNRVPVEHYISHFLLDVSFPTIQRPTVVMQLVPGLDDTITISQPSSNLPLPPTGASFCQLLSILGVDNTMNLLLFGLSEQKILLHSLDLSLLTGVAEAITAMLFPFRWQCPYVPLCPLSWHGILNAPVPLIVGIDSRCFDTFEPPRDIICIDLDTQSIYLSELKRCLNLKILPKRPARVLRFSLEKINQKLLRFQALGSNRSPQHRNDNSRQNIEKQLDLEIQEAFLRFMASILRGFRSYLLPITSAPKVGATDPTSLFDFDGFLSSRDRSYGQFYHLITKTQMFTHYIEERTFVSDKTTTSLAFFDDCEEKLSNSDDIFSDRPTKLFATENGSIQTDRSVYIPAPDYSAVSSMSNNNGLTEQTSPTRSNSSVVRFGPLNSALFHKHPQLSKFPSLDQALKHNNGPGNNENVTGDAGSLFSISRRTKQEVKASQKQAKKSSELPFEWSRYLVSCSYSLWFAILPSYIAFCGTASERANLEDPDVASKSTARVLRYAYSTIVRMQRLQLAPDEICFRVLTLLCGRFGQPALAVRIFFEMKKAGIKPNAITYGYYNKAVLESKWPDHSIKPTTVLWIKVRNVIRGVALFKTHGRIRRAKRTLSCVTLQNQASKLPVDEVDRAGLYIPSSDYIHPTTIPLNIQDSADSLVKRSKGVLNQHRRSLVNRSFMSSCPKSSIDLNQEDIAEPKVRNPIQKSHSMHLREQSPDKSSPTDTRSSSIDDDEEPIIVKAIVNHQTESKFRQAKSNLNLFIAMRDKYQLVGQVSGESRSQKSRISNESLSFIDNSAGVLFTSNIETMRVALRVSTDRLDTKLVSNNPALQSNGYFLKNSTTSSDQNNLNFTNEILKANSFGEDAQILMKLESKLQRPDFSASVDHLGLQSELGTNSSFMDETNHESNENRQIEHTTGDGSDDEDSYDEEEDLDSSSSQDDPEENLSLLKNITSTPNFKLTSLINDASNLQWSKWTSSQNSKSVYKGIKNAATGIVSSLQEIKSSFSISTSNTPAKNIVHGQHRSTGTREMLSQFANYFSSHHSRIYDGRDSDSSSLGSNDMFKLSNDEDVDPSSSDAPDSSGCYPLFEALEKHYGNTSSKEELIDHLSINSKRGECDRLAMIIRLSTCSRCNTCHSLLYDEEIMERWSYNDSNLNTRCVYCRAKIVPLMNIAVTDLRFNSQNQTPHEPELQVGPGNEETHMNSTGKRSLAKEQSFIVPYLSPIVLRKELESVFESSSDICPASSKFADEHPIIFWNLLWYFTRINVPTHLALLCLESQSILAGKQPPSGWQSSKVLVDTCWDQEKLHTEIGLPLYRLWKRGDPSPKVDAILCDKVQFTTSFLDNVLNSIRSNDLQRAMNLILNARLKNSNKFSFDKNRHNLYRDLLFLTIVALRPVKPFRDNFEREYRKAFEALNFQQVALNRFDRPPTLGSVFCRKYFKELALAE